MPFAFRIVLREGVLPIAAFLIAPFGATAVAAHAVATRVVDLTGVFAFGFSDAANMRVSHALGAAMPHRASRAGWIAIQLSTCVSALIPAGVMTEPSVLARWVFGDADPVGSAAAAALLPVAAWVVVLDGVQSGAGGALSGLRDAQGPLLISIVGSWAVGLPAGLLLARLTTAPVIGMWCGLIAGSCLTTCLYLHRFRTKMAAAAGLWPAA